MLKTNELANQFLNSLELPQKIDIVSCINGDAYSQLKIYWYHYSIYFKPFTFLHPEFPLLLAFAITVNKAQGQSLTIAATLPVCELGHQKMVRIFFFVLAMYIRVGQYLVHYQWVVKLIIYDEF